MERPTVSCAEILDRLSNVLPAIFNAYRIPEEVVGKILKDACFMLIAKQRLWRGNEERYLLRTIIERCRRPPKEMWLEDPPQ
jgi:hypothetical protein